MRFVTKLGGSSPGGNIPGYTEAGKSGTSEKIIDGKYSRNHFISSFIGLAPAKAPRLVLLVCLDEPEVKWVPGRGKNHNGGICSAPIFKDIAKRALEYLGVEPDDNQKVKEFAYETKELRQLHKKWNL
jgi:cell division protein FtsI (penicillin-binding protein 3)